MNPGTDASPPAPRQLIVLCDGTNNNLTGAERDTHVVLLAELLREHPDAARLVFYDPGVGNPGQVPGTTLWDKLLRQYQRLEGLAFGRGVFHNIAEGYLFLMRHWRDHDEDQIWLFGFSRGAFTARSIAGMVNRFGILAPRMESMVPTLLHLYFADDSAQVRAISQQATRLFALDAQRRPRLHFVGVWDTVATVGTWPFGLRIKAQPTLQGKHFVHVRQALALDEHRAQFIPRAYAQDNGPTTLAGSEAGSVEQLWFRGAHCDVGGGYAPLDSALARAPLAWLLAEAVRCGLRLRDDQGQPLDSEARVEHAAARTFERTSGQPDPVAGGQAQPLVHCQLRETPLWALSGMALRDTRVAAIDDAPPVPVRMAEHASVARWQPAFPRDTAWRSARPPLHWWLALVLCGLFLLALGQMQTGLPPGHIDAWASVRLWFTEALPYLRENAAFQRWQLTAWVSLDEGWWRALGRFASPRTALAWDLAFIASYAVVLSFAVSRAFAHAARFNRVGQAVPPWLNRLGWALPLLVIADLGENAVSWLAITLGHHEQWLLSWFARAAMAAASVVKFVGLAGVLALVIGQRWLQPSHRTQEPSPAR
jgi:uncharacterized protein (DUF2235 family)